MTESTIDNQFVFLAGHHRSGTSLLYKVLLDHPSINGFTNTGVPEDEGQHLQSVYKPAKAFGGPGKYIFDKRSYMDENHVLANPISAAKLIKQWQKHVDFGVGFFLEKSPPNLIRTRFFQNLFPKAKFIVILRHPLAISYATQKWSKTSIEDLLEHTLKGYEIFFQDLPFLESVYVLRYEDFVENPVNERNKIFRFLGVDESETMSQDIQKNVNKKYFSLWKDEYGGKLNLRRAILTLKYEKRLSRLGYSIRKCDEFL